MTTQQYLDTLNTRFKSGISREHSYRGDLESLIRSLVSNIEITNEPAKVTDCGNPDYVITNGKIPIGYIEAKDIGKNLNDKGYNEQFNRYIKALDNLIITDYIWFQFYQHGELVHEIRIADIENDSINPIPENFSQFENLIQDFCTFIGQTIKSSKRLAEMMAAKARLLQTILENAVDSDEATQENTSLKGQYDTFKEILIHDLTPSGFADIYAQTLAYGMFAARLHDITLNDFSRQEAAELIPKSNPFLRKLFQYVAGYDIDERIKTTVDNLADVFRATNIEAMLKNFGKSTQTHDPIIHFYETFLAEYDPKLRKARGVWYTPQPVVNFIVRAVDEVLKTEFDLPQGLADTSKTKIKVRTQSKDKRTSTGYKEAEQKVHKVQILDPATGTGTFLSEVIKFIYSNKFSAMQGAWSTYVDNHLIPRLNGFELLMASYSMAHLKLDMLLADTGYKASKEQRFNIYLTNSLEEHHPDTGTLFSNWLSTEANEANHIKRDTPVMCIIGNPPYSGESANKGDWIMNLMKDYKKEPNSNEKLKERNPKWINDDYVKFLRYGQHYIEKNGSGILAFINPHGFLDNPTFRGMRWNLLKTYDKIYTIDLHGNSKKKETCPDGSPDVNVFDIMQGVAITIFIKTGKKNTKELGKVYHYDLYGKREEKYNFLWKNSINTINYKELPNTKPNYYFVKKEFHAESKYMRGFTLNDTFPTNNVGIVTARDAFVIDENKEVLQNRIKDFFNLETLEIKAKYGLKENKSWKIDEIKSKAKEYNSAYIKKINYRPFDTKYIYFDKHFIERSRIKVMKQLLMNNNLALLSVRQIATNRWEHAGISNLITDDSRVSNRSKERGYVFPLYLYPDTKEEQIIEQENKRTPNLNKEVIEKISKKLSLTFTNEKTENNNTFAPIDILDYTYAILHSPTYREKYNEFLKIDFPRIPYPKELVSFRKLVTLGKAMREIHLFKSPVLDSPITQYPVDGNNMVSEISALPIDDPTSRPNHLRAYINDTQYFDNVPKVAWEFYIGGYQPAQKWLKDRKNRKLEYDDILHYQKIIVALTETDRIMKEIDDIEFD